MQTDVLSDLSPPALVTAIEGNLAAIFSLWASWPRAQVCNESDMLWSLTDIPFPLFNSVLHARLETDAADARIDAAIARCRSKGVPMLWWTGPGTRPGHLGQALQAHGFAKVADLPGMAADLDRLRGGAAVPSGLAIEPVTTKDAIVGWCDALVAGFGMPEFVGEAFADCFSTLGCGRDAPLRHYVGMLNGSAVATASLFLGAGVAGIYNVSVVPAARRAGVGAAMTLRPLLDAHALGYRVGILHASEMGAGVYQSLGFEEQCRIGHYVWTSASPGQVTRR